MGLFEHWPYVNFHDMNLDWVIKKIKNVETAEANSQASAEASADSAAASQLSADAALASQEAAHQSELNAGQSEENAAQSAENAAESAQDAADTVSNTVSQINLLQSRVDNIIPDGTQTEGNTELIDIRVAVDGEIYDSAGNSVRGQIEDFGAFYKSQNLYNTVTQESALLTSNGSTTPNAGWRTTDYIPVAGNENICIQADPVTATLNAIYYACYDGNKSVVLNRQTINITADQSYWIVSIPACAYIRVSFTPTQLEHFMVSENNEKQEYEAYFDIKKEIVSHKSIAAKWFYALLDNETLYTRTKYGNNHDFIVKFGKHNANNLPDFWTLYAPINANDYVYENINNITPALLSISSDWHGPFIVNAVNNIDGDDPLTNKFTGGNHLYNDLPTAVCDSLKYYIDGKETTEFSGLARKIEIRWTNSVQASNTVKNDGSGRNVIKEKHRLIFDGYKWTSYVDIEALEDIAIVTYYGYQMTGVNSIYPEFRFIGGNDLKEYDNAAAHNSNGKNVTTIQAHGTEHMIIMDLDVTYGIGSRNYYDGLNGAFSTLRGNKLYFYLIDNATFTEGDIISAKCDYMFTPA